MRLSLITVLALVINLVNGDETHSSTDMYEPNPTVGETTTITTPKATG